MDVGAVYNEGEANPFHNHFHLEYELLHEYADELVFVPDINGVIQLGFDDRTLLK